MDDVGHPEELPTVLSLCTGYGGIERGLELAGLEHRVITHVEIEAFAIANLVTKMEEGRLDAAPVWTNLKTLPVDCFRDRVSILTSGYPCQPFSAAGKRAGKDDPRHLWPYIVDIIKAVRPVRCFFENVEGHISLGLREVIEDLEGLGYSTAWGIFSASEVGAPHQRKRVFILANADGAGLETLRNQSGAERQASVVSESGELGNAQHDGSSSSEIRGGVDATGNNDSKGKNEASQSEGTSRSYGGSDLREELADTSGIGVQGLWSRGEQESDTYGETQLPMREGQRSTQTNWLPEPNVGRVVDGSADRVDRIRLLGNGVVPQTAAKAWLVLWEELNDRS